MGRQHTMPLYGVTVSTAVDWHDWATKHYNHYNNQMPGCQAAFPSLEGWQSA